MEIRCLFAQRQFSYPGENAPELLAAIDEYGDDENPDYLNNEQDKANCDDDVLFTKRIVITIPDKEFDDVFFSRNSIKGKIKE